MQHPPVITQIQLNGWAAAGRRKRMYKYAIQQNPGNKDSTGDNIKIRCISSSVLHAMHILHFGTITFVVSTVRR